MDSLPHAVLRAQTSDLSWHLSWDKVKVLRKHDPNSLVVVVHHDGTLEGMARALLQATAPSTWATEPVDSQTDTD